MLSNSKHTELIEIYQKFKKYYHINWNLTNKCNFSCEYCHPYNYEGSSPSFELQHYKDIVTKIKSVLDPEEELVISFTGGEPTALPIFEELVEWLYEQGVAIGLTTNGSKSIKFWEKTRHMYRWVSFSFHAEKSSVKHCLRVVETLWPYSMLSVRVMMHPRQQYFDKCVEFFDSIRDTTDPMNVHVEKVPVIDDWLTENERMHVYTEQQQEYITQDPIIKRAAKTVTDFMKYPMPLDVAARFRTADGRIYDEAPLVPHNLYLTNRINFRGWKCMAGIDGLFINERGLISRAACLPEEKIDGKIQWLGSIDRADEFEMPRKPIRCQKNECFCITDIIMGKER
jgi:MoaA/NifB/PqqE/SkfB family radical SAM enzyme